MSASVVLLQTDLVDSTRLADRLGDAAMATVWTAHDRLARELLGAWNGHEIDRSDGFLTRFASVDDALGFALVFHHRLARFDEPLQMRVGIHAGALLTRENSTDEIARGARALEVGGLSIPIVSRVTDLAIGGQTLLTADARALLGATSHRVLSYGHWRLKGLEEPLELFEAGSADAPFTPPPDAPKAYCVVRRNDLWVPRRTVPHSLPAERNAFVGRTAALARLAQRLKDGARLISIVGPGGTGKTRLAQRFGWKWLGDFEGGVWFCDLSQATTLDGLLSAVAQGLDVPLGTLPPIEQLGAAIDGRGACLVILDNLEQVTEHAGETIGHWLDRAPGARYIVTTRSVLNVNGEEVLSLAQMLHDEGVTLFMQRAKAARHDFRLQADDAPRLQALIALLDGLPLAIELAAARVRIMGISTLVERMKERFRLLASQTGHIGRHATLRAAFDWSWDLLTPADRAALAQASVFEGGFGLAAFEAVIDLSAIDGAPEPLDVLQSLVDKSWIQQSTDVRFGLLQSVQEYASERLGNANSFRGAGDEGRLAAQRRHWRQHAIRDPASAVEQGATDLDNFTQACRRATAAGDTHSAAGALENAWQILKLCGPFKAILPLASGVAAMADLTPADRALVDYVTGSVLLIVGSGIDAERCFDAGLVRARDAQDAAREAMLLCQISELHVGAGRTADALGHLEAAMRLCERLGDSALRCVVLNALGNLHRGAGALEDARRSYESALRIARERHDLRWEGGLLGNLGNVNHALGRIAEAREYYEHALTLVHRTGDRRWEGNTQCNLGLLCSEQNEPAQARGFLELALTSARQLGHRKLEFTVLCNLGILVEAEMRLDEACDLYRSALAIAMAIDDRRLQGQCYGYLGLLQARLGQADAASAALDQACELLAAVADQWNLALVLCGVVEVAIAARRLDRADTALRQAQAAIDAINASDDSPPGLAVAQARLMVEAQAPGAGAAWG